MQKGWGCYDVHVKVPHIMMHKNLQQKDSSVLLRFQLPTIMILFHSNYVHYPHPMRVGIIRH